MERLTLFLYLLPSLSFSAEIQNLPSHAPTVSNAYYNEAWNPPPERGKISNLRHRNTNYQIEGNSRYLTFDRRLGPTSIVTKQFLRNNQNLNIRHNETNLATNSSSYYQGQRKAHTYEVKTDSRNSLNYGTSHSSSNKYPQSNYIRPVAHPRDIPQSHYFKDTLRNVGKNSGFNPQLKVDRQSSFAEIPKAYSFRNRVISNLPSKDKVSFNIYNESEIAELLQKLELQKNHQRKSLFDDIDKEIQLKLKNKDTHNQNSSDTFSVFQQRNQLIETNEIYQKSGTTQKRNAMIDSNSLNAFNSATSHPPSKNQGESFNSRTHNNGYYDTSFAQGKV